MNIKALTTALKVGAKAGRLATSQDEREETLNQVEQMILLVLGIALLLFLGFIMFIALIVGSLTGGSSDAGFRSGTPTAFAVSDIPPDYLPIFLKAQDKHDVSWAVLAAMAKIESDFGQNMGPSEAGAIGFMQFMPDTWNKYKQDGDGDGECDPYSSWDAVLSAANMLKANGFEQDPQKALFSYNPAGWYVNDVMDQAAIYSSTMLPVGDGIWPLPTDYIAISSGYGNRMHPKRHEYGFHDGIDMPAPTGTPVYAVQDGHVDWNRAKGSYGLCIVLNHGSCRTLYGHLSEIIVMAGAEVKSGEVIGYVGSTGLSTGPHLHFSVFVNGQPTNPEEWLAIPSGNY